MEEFFEDVTKIMEKCGIPLQKKCEYCDEVFATRRCFRRHINTSHGFGWLCDKCGKDFSLQKTFNKHITLH